MAKKKRAFLASALEFFADLFVSIFDGAVFELPCCLLTCLLTCLLVAIVTVFPDWLESFDVPKFDWNWIPTLVSSAVNWLFVTHPKLMFRYVWKGVASLGRILFPSI